MSIIDVKRNKVLAVVLTPFHIRQLKVIANQFNINLSDAIILYDDIISENHIKEELGNNLTCIILPSDKISFASFINKPIIEFKRIRKALSNYHRFIDGIKKEIENRKDLFNVWIGTDKDILIQILSRKLKRSNKITQVIAIDEGIGFYRKPNWKHKLKNVIYHILSPVLFGNKISFVHQLGASNYIDECYVRFLNAVNKKSYIDYFEIPIHVNNSNRTVNRNNKCLVLTSPLSEDAICSAKFEQKYLSSLFSSLSNKEVVVKQHPRESDKKLKGLIKKNKLDIIEQSQSAEVLDYYEFEQIIQFSSSTIIDIYSSGYPLENVVTVDIFNGKNGVPHLFSKTNVIPFTLNKKASSI